MAEQQKKQQEQGPAGAFRPRTFKITIESPEDAEHFMQGLIIARSNNSSPYFQELIDAVNSILEPYRQAVIESQKLPSNARGRVSVE